MTRTALVLAAHGSHRHAASGEPARRHAAALAATGRFDQVVAAFWKEFPSLREVRYLVDAAEVFVVPLLMADGYFASRVVPRELDLTGPCTDLAGARWHYTPPVGTAPALRDVIADRVATALDGQAPLDEVAVVVVGHGTIQNRASELAARDHAARLAALGCYAEVAVAFLEEPPLVSDLRHLVSAPNVVVVPLFVADGLHTSLDIPRDLGLERDAEGRWASPGLVDGRRVWYTSSVGESPAMVDAILARVREARERGEAGDVARRSESALTPNPSPGEAGEVARRSESALTPGPSPGDAGEVARRSESALTPSPSPGDAGEGSNWGAPETLPLPPRRERVSGGEGAVPPWTTACLALLDSQPTTDWLDVRITPLGDGRYRLHHRLDEPADLTPTTDFRALARADAAGRYRPLPTAPDLARGWVAELTADELLTALDTLYPASLALWQAARTGGLVPVSWTAVARRQTGQMGLVKRLTPEDLRLAVDCLCRSGCLRTIVWDLGPGEPLGSTAPPGPVPCPEACSLLVSFARQISGFRRGEEVRSRDPWWQRFRTAGQDG